MYVIAMLALFTAGAGASLWALYGVERRGVRLGIPVWKWYTAILYCLISVVIVLSQPGGLRWLAVLAITVTVATLIRLVQHAQAETRG